MGQSAQAQVGVCQRAGLRGAPRGKHANCPVSWCSLDIRGVAGGLNKGTQKLARSNFCRKLRRPKEALAGEITEPRGCNAQDRDYLGSFHRPIGH